LQTAFKKLASTGTSLCNDGCPTQYRKVEQIGRSMARARNNTSGSSELTQSTDGPGCRLQLPSFFHTNASPQSQQPPKLLVYSEYECPS
jgi:hypothetical protein